MWRDPKHFMKPIMSDGPQEKLAEQYPSFTKTSVDYIGPFQITINGRWLHWAVLNYYSSYYLLQTFLLSWKTHITLHDITWKCWRNILNPYVVVKDLQMLSETKIRFTKTVILQKLLVIPIGN